MKYIQHRVNSLEALRQVPLDYGVEIDVRYVRHHLVLTHDAFHGNVEVTFQDFVKAYSGREGVLIVNLKTEGIEEACSAILQHYGIKHWFFLDMSMPYMVKYSLLAADPNYKQLNIENLAVRYSEYEPIEYALAFKGRAGWVWVDCFTHYPLNAAISKELRQAGLSICLVSPELQKHDTQRILDWGKPMQGLYDAVCTKRPDLWIALGE